MKSNSIRTYFNLFSINNLFLLISYYIEAIVSKMNGFLNVSINLRMLDTKLTGETSAFIKNEIQEIEIFSAETIENSKVKNIFVLICFKHNFIKIKNRQLLLRNDTFSGTFDMSWNNQFIRSMMIFLFFNKLSRNDFIKILLIDIPVNTDSLKMYLNLFTDIGLINVVRKDEMQSYKWTIKWENGGNQNKIKVVNSKIYLP